uniref:Odorant receptor n=1 Tax=Culicoides sonorensis TaxID=179676 RepID=A0A336KCV3_CULSO
MLYFQNKLRRLKRFKDDHDAFYFFNRVCRCCNRWARPIGLSMMDEGFTPKNARFIFLVTWNFTFVLININSVVNRKNEDMVEIFNSCITIGMALQGLVKQYTFSKHYKEILHLVESGTNLYHKLKHEKIIKIARDFAFFGWFIVIHFLRYAYTVAVAGCILIPIMYSHILGPHRILPFDVELPFINPTTNFGYWINVILISVSGIMETIGLVASDGIYIVLLLNGFTQLENIFFELECLDELILKKSDKISAKLNEIIQLHQKYISYIRRINEMFLMYFTVNVVTMVYQIVISLFILATVVRFIFFFISHIKNFNLLQLQNNKISAPLLVFTGSCQLLITCVVGTVLEVKHDKLILCTYDVCWYDMEIKEQKKLKLLLQAAQQDVYIEYVFGALNIPLFVEIYKKIYSGLTMLVNSQQHEGPK